MTVVASKSDGWYVDSSFTTDEMSPVITDADATDASRDATSTSTTPSLKHCKIWTRRFRSANMMKDVETPLVMIHGMGAGLALFCLNFDSLVKERTVYAIDLPGTYHECVILCVKQRASVTKIVCNKGFGIKFLSS